MHGMREGHAAAAGKVNRLVDEQRMVDECLVAVLVDVTPLDRGLGLHGATVAVLRDDRHQRGPVMLHDPGQGDTERLFRVIEAFALIHRQRLSFSAAFWARRWFSSVTSRRSFISATSSM